MLFTSEAADYKERWKNPFDPQADIVNIKEQYVKVLNYLLSDMALFCGIAKTNTLDIIDALVIQKVFTPESGFLLKESVAAIYKIRIRLHLHYKEQREEASCLQFSSFATLSPEELSALEKCYWLVLHPLYTCLRNVVDPLRRSDFKEVFRDVDLVEIAFQENLSLKSEPLIKLITSHLCLIQAPSEVHVRYFSTLSSGPHDLRERYLEIIEKMNSTVFQMLLQIPNRTGLRPIFLRNFQKLKEKLYEITEPLSSQVEGETEVLIEAPHFQKARYLKPCFIKQIMDGENIRSMYDNSAHNVSFINEGLHFKQKPAHPLLEYAIHNLTSRIAGQLTPPSLLIRFDVHTKGGKRSYPLLLSQTIPGENLKDVWQKIQTSPPSPLFTWTLLCSILTKPGGGRLSNYIFDKEQNLHCVNNDLSFVEPVISSSFSRRVYFCCVLFCLFPLETLLDQEVLQHFFFKFPP
ncbi:MAG: hypothetical protein H0T62_04595 [Parachlamydiaceae bacterium]|nr:hypothetical protein [Parachlamydiaceae bacterium]